MGCQQLKLSQGTNPSILFYFFLFILVIRFLKNVLISTVYSALS